jgi:hypothetical protein
MLKYGTSPDTPFPTKGMTLEQFDHGVPMGAWYTDQNGTIRQRTVEPQTQNPQSSSGSQMQDYYDTGLATQPVQ